MNAAFLIALAASLAIVAPSRGAEPAPEPVGHDSNAMPVPEQRLVPSEASGDDCAVDAGIDVAPDRAMRRLHVRLCEANVEAAYRDRCATQARELRSIRFVTDHCDDADAPEVSLGGRAYRVRRVGAATDAEAPSLAGTFEGDGLRMQIRPGAVLRENLEEGERIGLVQEVVVTLTLDGRTRTLPATYSDGP